MLVKLVSSAQINEKIGLLACQIASLSTSKRLVLVPVLTGAAYFGVDLSRQLWEIGQDHLFLPINASSYGDEKVGGNVFIGNFDMSKIHEDDLVILVDELYDTGNTLASLKEMFVSKNSEVLSCTMFSKNTSSKPDLLGMQVDDKWLVGYGLDNEGMSRGTRDLYYLEN